MSTEDKRRIPDPEAFVKPYEWNDLAKEGTLSSYYVASFTRDGQTGYFRTTSIPLFGDEIPMLFKEKEDCQADVDRVVANDLDGFSDCNIDPSIIVVMTVNEFNAKREAERTARGEE